MRWRSNVWVLAGMLVGCLEPTPGYIDENGGTGGTGTGTDDGASGDDGSTGGSADDGTADDGSTGSDDGSTGSSSGSTGSSSGSTESGPTECGDGTAQAPEQCDGDDLADQDCESLGYGPGTLACDASCLFDASGCEPIDCGASTTPLGPDPCPEVCHECGGQGAPTCELSCGPDGAECTDEVFACPPDWDCTLTCNGPGGCQNVTLVCLGTFACDIDCRGSTACQNVTLDCAGGQCQVRCRFDPDACQGVTVNCSTHDARSICQTPQDEDPNMVPDPESTCSCELDGC